MDFPGGPVAKSPCVPNAGGLGLIPGWGTRSLMLQQRAHMPQLKSSHAATKDSGCYY